MVATISAINSFISLHGLETLAEKRGEIVLSWKYVPLPIEVASGAGACAGAVRHALRPNHCPTRTAEDAVVAVWEELPVGTYQLSFRERSAAGCQMQGPSVTVEVVLVEYVSSGFRCERQSRTAG